MLFERIAAREQREEWYMAMICTQIVNCAGVKTPVHVNDFMLRKFRPAAHGKDSAADSQALANRLAATGMRMRQTIQ